MYSVVTVEQMQKMDQKTIANGTDGKILMDRAGKMVAEMCASIMEGKDFFALILAGAGNNGGDGWVCARYLHEMGVKVLVISMTSDIKNYSKYHFDLSQQLPVQYTLWEESEQFFNDADIVIDALLGTGTKGAPRGKFAKAIEMANSSGKPIIAVDIPSGVDGNTGQIPGIAIDADYTVTMACPKIGHLVYPGRANTGDLNIAEIGIDTQSNDVLELLQLSDAKSLLPIRHADGHKGSFGKAYIVAGCFAMSGAAAITSLAYMRSGAGLAYLGTSKEVIDQIAGATLEIVKHPIPSVGKFGAISLRALGEIHKKLKDVNSLIIGPGLGNHHETAKMVIRLLEKNELPTVIDADALNFIAGKDIKLNCPTIMTPHCGELSRLLDISVDEINRDKFQKASLWAEKLNAVLVIKGSPTIIAQPLGKTTIITCGNDGMATAGSGDVLTGIIGGFLAQGLKTIDAAQLGVFVHGVAGDVASVELGKRGMTATDILNYLPNALQIIESDE